MKSRVNVSQCTLVVCVLTLILVCVLLFRETREGFFNNQGMGGQNPNTQMVNMPPEAMGGQNPNTQMAYRPPEAMGVQNPITQMANMPIGTNTGITREHCEAVKNQYEQCRDVYDDNAF